MPRLHSIQVCLLALLFFSGLLDASAAWAEAGHNLFSPVGKWVAPGIDDPLELEISEISGGRLDISVEGVSFECAVLARLERLVHLQCPEGDETILLQISNNALAYSDGVVADQLLVRSGLENLTFPPAGAWIEINPYDDEPVVLDFDQGTYIRGEEQLVLEVRPAQNQMQFPGLAVLNVVGNDFMECVRMGDDVLACRRIGPEDLYDGSFIGFGPLLPER